MLAKLGELLKGVLASGSFRRFLALMLALASTFLAKKFGLVISDEMQAKILEVIMVYLAQSGAVAIAQVIKKPAPVVDLAGAAAVLAKGPTP